MPKGKRSVEPEERASGKQQKGQDGQRGNKGEEKDEDMLDFEDEFEDEFEEEEMVGEAGSEDENGGKEEEEEEEEVEEGNGNKRVWRPGVDPIEEGEVLEYDPSAYHVMHAMEVQYPCLSFSLLTDSLGEDRTKYPHTFYMVTGTQAPEASSNCAMVMKITGVNKLPSEDSEEEDEEGTEDDPVLDMRCIPHDSCINRIRTRQIGDKVFAALWSEKGVVSVYNFSGAVRSLDSKGAVFNAPVPLHVNSVHKTEGYALDWSPLSALRLLSGDNDKAIFETVGSESGVEWKTEKKPYVGHSSSVEDIQWSPTENNVFASCSSDKTVKIWDARANKRSAVLSIAAHEADINAISWNKKVAYLLASGSDDNSLKIWDLRNFKEGESVAHYQYHHDQIVSIEWNPFDETQVVVASADNQVTIWDLSLEADEGEDEEVPPQLFFVHQGQQDIKEVHWHPHIPNLVVSTAYDGFNIFKPSNT